ncbi:hypothetical protein V8E54_010824 [Elaphomyces granulatus]
MVGGHLCTITGVVQTVIRRGGDSGDAGRHRAKASYSLPPPFGGRKLAEQPSTYRISRGIISIPNPWLEWTVGLGGVGDSVEALDERWGSRWRRGAVFQFYSRRKVIIDEAKQPVAGPQGEGEPAFEPH